MFGFGDGRRRSSVRMDALEQGSSSGSRASIVTGRSPRLPVSFQDHNATNHHQTGQRRSTVGKHAINLKSQRRSTVTDLGNGFVGLPYVRRRRGLLMLVAVPIGLLIILLARGSTSADELRDAVSSRRVPTAILPIIREGGNIIHRISPKVGSKVKSWHDHHAAKAAGEVKLTEEEIEARSQHTFHPNGLLLVNPKGKHPIFTLIERAEKRWNDKKARQSRTLSEAVREYKVRYKRNPPKGFDDWWKFCEENNVPLRDEYDQIHLDLSPHWALEHHDSRHRNQVMQDRDHTFTTILGPAHKLPGLKGEFSHTERAVDMQALLGQFSARLPRPINLTFVIDDNPAVLLPYNERARMMELAEQGEYWGPSEFTPPDETHLSNFAQSCAPNSPLRRSERGEPFHDYSIDGQRSFIWHQAKAVDLCNHPGGRKSHGHYMGQGVPPGPLVPLLSFAKTNMQADILVTPLEQYSETYVGFEPAWEGKSRNKLLWRGSTTGVEFDRQTPWRQSQRARLHMMSQYMDGNKNVIWASGDHMREANFTVADLNHLYMDTSFSGKPAQCDPETCKWLSENLDFKPTIGLEESNLYKYMMDVDGNGWSGRFHRLMSSRSVVLKATAFPEWYHDRIEPWIHYIPIKLDYSDLYDIMTFFVGTPEGQGAHDTLAEKIGAAGKEWAGTHWRKADMAAYMYRLTLEYSRILAFDLEPDVDYVEEPTFIYDEKDDALYQ